MSPIPKFCIVVPVNHNIGYFRMCLESLERLDYSPDRFKVVTVDCGQVPGLDEFARTELLTFKIPLLHLSLPARPPSDLNWMHEHRMNEARNAAVAACPAEHYIFTEDDTSFHPDWLHKTEKWINDRTGALGGPDVLPERMGPLPEALDELLNSPLGSPGRSKQIRDEDFCPRKDYLVMPANILAAVGPFPEKLLFGAEIEMCRRIRAGGWDVKYMADNPIWHRRVTTINTFLKRNVHIAREKVQLLQRQGRFWKSAHALVLYAAVVAVAISVLACFNRTFAEFWLLGFAAYALLALALALRTLIRKRHMGSAAVVMGLLPCHHASVACGVLLGLFDHGEETFDGPPRA